MVDELKVESVRTTFEEAGETKFKIEMSCTDKGELPDTGIFLYHIFDERNSLVDEFTRIVNINDIEVYSGNRNTAIENRQELWRSTFGTFVYTDVNVANQAARILSDRLNTLVNDYYTYKTSFKTTPGTPDEEEYPTAQPSYIEELKTAYADSVTAYYATEAAAWAAYNDFLDAETALATANDNLNDWIDIKNMVCGYTESGGTKVDGLVTEMERADTAFRDLLDSTAQTPSSLLTFMSGVDIFIAAFDFYYPTGGDITAERTTFESVYRAFIPTRTNAADNETNFTGWIANHTAACAYLNDPTTGKIKEKEDIIAAAETDVYNKNESYIVSLATRDAAYTFMEEELQKVEDVCPGWDPDPPKPSPPPTPPIAPVP